MKKKVLVTKNLLKETEERVKKLFDVKLNKEEVEAVVWRPCQRSKALRGRQAHVK